MVNTPVQQREWKTTFFCIFVPAFKLCPLLQNLFQQLGSSKPNPDTRISSNSPRSSATALVLVRVKLLPWPCRFLGLQPQSSCDHKDLGVFRTGNKLQKSNSTAENEASGFGQCNDLHLVGASPSSEQSYATTAEREALHLNESLESILVCADCKDICIIVLRPCL